MTAACRRRAMLRAAGAALLSPGVLGGVRPARAAEPMRMLVAGAPGGRLAGWVAALGPALQRGWLGFGGMAIEMQGGDDGVTGANQFEARGPLDSTALLLPGAAALAWLAGDPRVQFDAARWLPLLCGVSGGVLAGRRTLADARPQDPLRLAVADPLGPGAACLLGLDLLGVAARPMVQIGRGEAEAAVALRSGQADAAFLTGGLSAAVAAGATPLLTLGSPASQPDGVPDQAPSLAAWLGGAASRDAALLAGWSAAAASVQLEYALVLPALTDAASVARWRHAACHAVRDPALLAAAPPDVRSLSAPDCNAVLGAIATRSEALLAYRRWLAFRLGYQPG